MKAPLPVRTRVSPVKASPAKAEMPEELRKPPSADVVAQEERNIAAADEAARSAVASEKPADEEVTSDQL